jgi:hypothetical protein
MTRPSAPTRSRVLVIASLVLLVTSSWTRPAAQSQAANAAPQPAEPGARLFLGQVRFANGGPPCAACHQLSSLAFPNGGIVGPDLSLASETLGEEGTTLALQTLFFPTMMPLYDKRPLTPDEQQAMKALLMQTRAPAPPGQGTLELAGIAGLGFLVLAAAAWLASRRRLRGVRAPLVRRTAPGGARP